MSRVQRMAAATGSPAAAAIGPVRDATSTGSILWAIPAEWSGKFVRFTLQAGTRGFIRFGTSAAVTVDGTTENAIDGVTGVITVGTAQPHIVLEPGASVDELIDPSWTHLAHLEGATGGFLIAALKTANVS